ncbi:MAG: Crp/Fnr family transcriptional regulator, partial [Anaerolineaceae bacterium]
PAPAGCLSIATMNTPRDPDDHCKAAGGITLEHLPRDESLGRLRHFPKGSYVWQPDDAADRIYFLRKGRVMLMTAMPHERPVALHTIEPDQPFGEMCLCSLRTETRGTTAHALVESEALEIKQGKFLSYLHQNQAALGAFMFTLCARLKDACHRIEVMAHRGAEQRLGSLLLRLATSRERQGRVARRDWVNLSVSHNELAQLAGMSRPHVTVTMGRLRRRGLVQSERESVVVVEVASLSEYLGRVVREKGRKRSSASAERAPHRPARQRTE